MSGIFNAVLGATRKLVKTLSGATDEDENVVVEENKERRRSFNKDEIKQNKDDDDSPKWISSRRKRPQTPEATSETIVVPTKKPKSKEVVVEKPPQEKVESDTEEIDSNLLQKLIKEAQEWKEKQKQTILDKEAPVDLLRSSGSFRKEKPLREVKSEEIWKMPPTMKLSLKSLLPPYYKDTWDNYHVKMPCSPKNLYQKDTSSRALSKWYQICSVLSVPIHHSKELQDAIHTINDDINDFDTLHYVINEALSEEQATKFLSQTLPQMAYLAMKLPDICPESIPLLLPDKDATVTLNQLQVASLLANAFFCTFPIQGGSLPIESENSKKIKYKRISIPSISFEGLYEGNVKEGILPSQAAKLQCIIHYFTRVCDRFADNFSTLNNKGTNITFHRKVLKDAPNWANSEKLLTELIVSADELIEDVEEPHIEMDFANKMIGGGVLRRGCIQEEIRFVINTELIVSLLFTAKMEDHECVVITGAERYSKYTGYSYTFEWVDDFQDNKPIDDLGRISTCVVAIDALYFGVPQVQYLQANIERELNKSYLGFDINEGASTQQLPIATGNWGCGAFGGYHDLKSIIQLLAAAEAGRDVTYFTFSHPGLAPSLQEAHTHLKANNITVGQIFKAVVEIEKEFSNSLDVPQLFNLLIEKFE